MSKSKRMLLAGGGTGGHVLAGLALADLWKAQSGSTSDILFVGAVGGMEEKLVPKAGYTLRLLSLGALNRVSKTRKIKTVLQLPFSLLRALFILLQFRPQVVIGVGGYSSGPTLLVAKLLCALRILRIRIGVLEQNAVPGFTNRILGKLADTIFVAFPGIEDQFPGREVIFSGNPIRSEIRPMSAASRNPLQIFIFGGSQGAMGINTLILSALPHLKKFEDRLKFVHQTGESDFERVQKKYAELSVPGRIEKFIYDMPGVYSQSSLLICRAGSSTLAELAAVGRAALLIPLPTASDNHQEENARSFSEKGAAVLLVQKETTGEKLASLIIDFLAQPEKLLTMEDRVRQFYRPNAAQEIISKLTENLPA